MILFPLLTFLIWLQVFTAASLPTWKLALIPGARSKAKQDRPDDGNLVQ
jgi:hypothetical protein